MIKKTIAGQAEPSSADALVDVGVVAIFIGIALWISLSNFWLVRSVNLRAAITARGQAWKLD